VGCEAVVFVRLTDDELRTATSAAVGRIIAARQKGRRDRYGRPGDRWLADIGGCAAELAVARATGRYWVATEDPSPEGDVGDLQVRWTGRPDGRLIVHPKDPDDVRFVLVRGAPEEQLEIAGWIYGRDAKHDNYWFPGDGRPAFFVPAPGLTPIEELT
jgi:hypothetical protein